MIEIKVEWDKEQLKILLSRLKDVEKLTRYYIEAPGQLPRQLSIGYVEAVRAGIIKNPRTYAPYSKKYEEWKTTYGKYSGFWRLMGDLFVSIKSFKFANGWYGGIKYGTIDQGGKSWDRKGKPKPIVMYAKVMEYGMRNIRGLGKHPARPLFVPVFRDFVFSKSKSERGNAWGISEKALEKIGNKWEGK